MRFEGKMGSSYSEFKKKQFFKLSNLIPLLTVFVGIIAISFSLLGLIKLTIPEGIVISLLALLAFDALTERLSILARIENHLRKISVGQALRTRDVIPPLQEYARNASEICIAAVSAMSICHPNIHFFRKKLEAGCNIKIALLDPESPTLQTFYLQYGMHTAQKDIQTSLECLEGLVKEKCEVRLLKVFLPLSMVAVDLEKESGSILVEFHAYKKTVGERPHVLLTPQESSYWFNFYKQQFEQAWSDASPWKP